jgi:DNA polymerase III delta prime subunit
MVAPPITREKGFPRELLAGSVKERLDYFHEYKVYHAQLLEVKKALLRAIHYHADALLIFLFGPPGVGKTTLLLHLIEHLLKEAQPTLAQNPGYLPLLYLRAPPPDKPRYTWADFYTEYLQAGDEPLIDHKVDLDRRAAERAGKTQKLPRGQERTQDLRRAVIKMDAYRRPGVVFLDEAQHIGQGIGSAKLRDQLDCLKTLASETGVVHVLLGPYELVEMRNASAQLGWRSRDIHFSRYHVENPEDRKNFQGVLKAFQKQMPLEETPNLVQYWRFLADGSIGCVGKLKQWLEDALTVALEENASTLLKKHL